MPMDLSNNIGWNPININFNDANSAMGNALEGFSRAGDVFSKMRKQLIDEEQKAIENEQWEKGYALDKARDAEVARHNLAGEDIDKYKAESQDKYWQGSLENEAFNNKTQRMNVIGANGLRKQQGFYYAQQGRKLKTDIDLAITNRTATDKADYLVNNIIHDRDGVLTESNNKIASIKANIDLLENMPDDQWKNTHPNSPFKNRQEELDAYRTDLVKTEGIAQIANEYPSASLSSTGVAAMYEKAANIFGYQGDYNSKYLPLSTQIGVDNEKELAKLGDLNNHEIKNKNEEYAPKMPKVAKDMGITDPTEIANIVQIAKDYAELHEGTTYQAALALMGKFIDDGHFKMDNDTWYKIIHGENDIPEQTSDKSTNSSSSTILNSLLPTEEQIDKVAQKQTNKSIQGKILTNKEQQKRFLINKEKELNKPSNISAKAIQLALLNNGFTSLDKEVKTTYNIPNDIWNDIIKGKNKPVTNKVILALKKEHPEFIEKVLSAQNDIIETIRFNTMQQIQGQPGIL